MSFIISLFSKLKVRFIIVSYIWGFVFLTSNLWMFSDFKSGGGLTQFEIFIFYGLFIINTLLFLFTRYLIFFLTDFVRGPQQNQATVLVVDGYQHLVWTLGAWGFRFIMYFVAWSFSFVLGPIGIAVLCLRKSTSEDTV